MRAISHYKITTRPVTPVLYQSQKCFLMKIDLNYSDSKHAYICIHSHSIFKLSYPTWACTVLGPTTEEVSWILQFFSVYCNARTDWLSPGENKTDPWVIQVGYRGDTISTLHTHAHTAATTLGRQNIRNAPCQPRRILQSKAFLFDMALTVVQGLSTVGLRSAMGWTAVGNWVIVIWTAWGFVRLRKTEGKNNDGEDHKSLY